MPAPDWPKDAVFYHIYPLGMCGAPWRNDFALEPETRLKMIHDWIPHLGKLGVNAVYIGPLWESGSHGYDTVSYVQPDRRLGTYATLQNLIQALHHARIRVVLDAVFNHVGRDFFAFRSVQRLKEKSPYKDWFHGLKFNQRSPQGDPFWYEGWKGHFDLAKLNLSHAEVRQHIFEAVRQWIEFYRIDGLRFDAADCMDKDFLAELTRFCRRLNPDFWLMGEVVMGDYTEWGLDSITNYELYDSFHKAHNTHDYERLAQTLDRQYGADGQYQNLPLYNFADNHDVNRIASLLRRQAHIYPLYLLLFTVPGIPSLYYGSEVGLEGKRLRWSDRPLRPFLADPNHLQGTRHPDLIHSISRLADLRHQLEPLRRGGYRTLWISKETIIFERYQKSSDSRVIVMVNMARSKVIIKASELGDALLNSSWQDVLNPGGVISCGENFEIHSHWGRILVPLN